MIYFIYMFIIYSQGLVFFYQLIHYLNGYIKSSHEIVKEKKKFELKVRMLKGAKEKAKKEAGEASVRADTINRRAKDAEAALRRAVKENSRLLERIKKLEAQLKATEKKATEAASKVVEDFRISEKYEDEKAEYSADVYDVGK